MIIMKTDEEKIRYMPEEEFEYETQYQRFRRNVYVLMPSVGDEDIKEAWDWLETNYKLVVELNLNPKVLFAPIVIRVLTEQYRVGNAQFRAQLKEVMNRK